MFSGRCGSRNNRISEEGGGQSLTDVLSLVHMHNIHPGANIHPGCKFAPGVYFGHVNGAL